LALRHLHRFALCKSSSVHACGATPGLFYEAAMRYQDTKSNAEVVRVYEKVRSGIWVYNGMFYLIDAYQQEQRDRVVFKFKLIVADEQGVQMSERTISLLHARSIPTSVKQEVWKRDKGMCVECGSTENLHFDHILPFSRGGTSLSAANVQLLCMKCNLAKRDHIQ